LEIHFTWLVVFFLFFWSLSTGQFPRLAPRAPGVLYWLAGLLASALFFGSLLLHELAHSLMAKHEGLRVERITLFIFGGLAQLGEEPRSAVSEFRIAAVGPLTSASLGVTMWLLSKAIFGPGPALLLLRQTLAYVGAANLFVAVFNAMPAFPLDGGRLVRSVLWAMWGDLRHATGVAASLGKLFGYGLGGVGVWMMIGMRGYLLDGLWLIFLGWLLAAAAEQAYQQVQIAVRLRPWRVADFMSSPAITVPADISLAEFAERYDFMLRHGAYPVVREGRVVGMLERAVLQQTPRHLWPAVSVAEAMTPLDMEAMVVPADETLAAVFTRLLYGPYRRLMVMGRQRQLVGVISYSDVLRALRMSQWAAP
jgi:Zn-dependent protease/predicted transcriptional regulator